MTDLDNIDNWTASHLIRRALAILSRQYGTTLELERFGNGQVCLVTKNREIASFSIPFQSYSLLYCESAKRCLELLMNPEVVFKFSPLEKGKRITVQFSGMFGKTIDELKIKLDLLENG